MTVIVLKNGLPSRREDLVLSHFLAELRSNSAFSYDIYGWGERYTPLALRFGADRVTSAQFYTVAANCSEAVCRMALNAIRSFSEVLHGYCYKSSDRIVARFSESAPADVSVTFPDALPDNPAELEDAIASFMYALGHRQLQIRLVVGE